MNFNRQNFGDGAHNIFQVSTTSSNTLVFGSTGMIATTPTVFGDTSHKIASNTSGFGPFNQPNSTVNAASNTFAFGTHPTLTKLETRIGPPVFGSASTETDLFVQNDQQSSGSLFPSTDLKGNLKMFGQNTSNGFTGQNVAQASTSQNVFGSLQTPPALSFGSNPGGVFGSFGSTSATGGLQTPVFGNFGNPATVSSSTDVFGAQSNPQQSSAVFASFEKKPQPQNAFGNGQIKGIPSYTGKSGETSNRIASPRRNVLARGSEGMTRIEVQNIPEQMNNKNCLQQHFSKFGKVLRIASRSNGSAIVAFETHEAAKNAKENGHFIAGRSEPVIINFKSVILQRDPVPIGRPRFGTVPNPENSMTQEVGDNLDFRGNKNIDRSNMRDVVQTSDDYVAAGDDGSVPVTVDVVRQKPVERSVSPQLLSKYSDESTLKGLASTRATNSDDKFRILEQRDKIIRNATQKSSDLATSEVVRGTCLDMCPEKERYMRECRRRLSVFEMVPGTDLPGQNPLVDHSRAVKEYSRSSADQEMPLPSELRPPRVLDETMDYLLTYIMDKGRVGFWAEWYDFLWNRMRGIRKDITQQMLCDTTSVELVEKSARFHILCSELLCEEDPGVFDQKINSENLTKCLQTLKELYHDLHVKHGIVCRNEAEFRSYMLLMNINNAGDILREAQQWRSEVRLSTAFKSSLHVYSSVTSNNYIKFFNLVKRASYLDSCILHRYFNQVRSVAVTRIAKAFNSPAAAHSISYPFRDLINHLGFESSEEAVTFLANFGLVVTNGLITSDKKQGKVTELEGVTLPIRRSSKLVGSKVTTSLGEIVNGGPLPKAVNHVPHESFNEQGYFLLDEVDTPIVRNQSAPDLIRPPRLSFETRDSAAPPSRQTINEPVMRKYRPTLLDVNEAIGSVLQDIAEEVTSSMIKEVSDGTIDDSHRFVLIADLSGEAVLREAVEECVRECSVETIVQVNKEKEELARQANQTAAQIYEEVIQFEIRNICTDALKSALLADTQLRRDNAVSSLVDEILNEVSVDEAEEYCQQYYQSRVKKVLSGLEDIRANNEKILMRRAFKNWIVLTKQRQIDKKFPSTVNLQQNSAEVFQSMFPRSNQMDFGDAMSHDFLPLDGSFGVSLLMTDEIISKQEEIKLNLEREEANIMERRKHCWSPLGVLGMAEDNLVSTTFRCPIDSKVFWKLIVSLPNDGCVFTHNRDLFTKWLSRKFKMSEDDDLPENGADMCLLHSKPLVIPSAQGMVASCYASLNVCIRSVADAPNDSDILGASSILFFIRDHSDFSSDYQTLEMESRRLQIVLRSKPANPPLPLVVMGSSKNRNWTNSFITERLRLQTYLEKGLINSFVVELHDDLCVNDVKTTGLLEDGIKRLMQRSPNSPPLHTQTIVEFFEGNIHRFFTKPILNNLKRRKEKSCGDLPLSTLVDLYNRVVRWLVQIVTASELSSMSWPPSEFCDKYEDLPSRVWNTKEKLINLESFVHRSVLLPNFPQMQDSTFVDVGRALSEYVKLVTAKSNSPLKLVTKINNLLEKTKMEAASRKNARRNKKRSLEASYFTPPPSVLPRTSIVLACIDFKLSELFGIKDSYDNRPVMVTYFTDALQEQNAPSLDSSSNFGLEESSMDIGVSENHQVKAVDSFTLYKSSEFVFNGVHNLSSLDLESSLSIDLSLLFDQISSEKEASHNFGKFLEEVLEDADGSIFENQIKSKKAKLMSEEEMKSLSTPVNGRNDSALLPEDLFHMLNSHNRLEDDMNNLKFKIAQEKKASVLLDLKTKLYLDDLLG